MTNPSPRKPAVFFDSDDEQEDLDLFCRIEKILQNDNTINDSTIEKQEEQSRLASQFPTSFIQHPIDENNNDSDDEYYSANRDCNIPREEIVQFHESYKELQNKINYINMKEKEIEKQSNWINQEKKELERARKRIEEDRVIAEANLSNIELIDLRKKYQELQAKYNEEKNQWNKEKQSLLSIIHQLKGDAQIDDMIPQLNEGEKNKSMHVDFQLPNENSDQNVDQEESYSSNVHSFQSFKIGSTSSSSSSKKGTSNNKKSIQVSVFNDTPLHPGYKLDLLFDPGPVIKEESRQNDKRKLLRYKNNLTATLFPNGTRKMKYKDNIFIFYANGDTAQEFQDGARGYRYAETGAIELQLPDKTIYYDFPEEVPTKQKSRQVNTRQREIHYPNGKKEILFPNGQRKVLFPNGDYEIYYPSGKILNALEY